MASACLCPPQQPYPQIGLHIISITPKCCRGTEQLPTTHEHAAKSPFSNPEKKIIKKENDTLNIIDADPLTLGLLEHLDGHLVHGCSSFSLLPLIARAEDSDGLIPPVLSKGDGE